MKGVFLFTFLLICFEIARSDSVQGQDEIIPKKRFAARTINGSDGLADNIVTGIVTDINGFTWVSTFTALQQYDGYRMRNINPVVGKDTFKINYPVYLFLLHDHHILICTKKGALDYNPFTAHFTKLIQYITSDTAYYGLIPLLETNEGIWCIQEHKGIVLYDQDGSYKNRFNFFDPKITDGLLQNQYLLYSHEITGDSSEIYINDFAKDVLYINTKKRTAATLSFPGKILGLLCYQNKLYVSMATELLQSDPNGNFKLLSQYPPLPNHELVTAAGLISSGPDILASINGHLYRIDSSGNFRYELCDLNGNNFISSGFIQQTYSDGLNRIWLISNDGLKRIQNSEIPFQHLYYPDEKNNFVRALYYDEKNHWLLAGGFDGRLQWYDSTGAPLWKNVLSTGLSEFILGIEKLDEHQYLFTTFHRGWFVLDLKSEGIRPLHIPEDISRIIQPDKVNYPNNLQRISDSVVLIATGDNVFKCIFAGDNLVAAKPLLPFNLDGDLDCFTIGNGTLWVGTYNGAFYKVSGNNAQSIAIPEKYPIRTIVADSNLILVGTEKGMLIYDTSGNFRKKIDAESGLYNDCIYGILTASRSIFVSTNQGVSEIYHSGKVQNYSREMGLQENEFNTGATVRTNTGRLFFGGVSGITALYPATLSQVKDSFLIHVIQFTVNDFPYDSSLGAGLKDSLRLNYRQNHLKFDLVANGMLNADEYIYQYRMSPLDTTWETTSDPRTINYTLQPGYYQLQVRCFLPFSSNFSLSRNFFISISPPWWQMWWARLLAFMIAVGVIYFIVYWYNRKKYLDRIKALETQRQIQNERERISRELHDNIGAQMSLMINNIDWTIHLSDETSRAEEKNRLISINETARSVMGNLRESIWALNKEKISLEEFADRLKSYVQQIMQAKPALEFSFKEDIQQEISLLPTETLNLFRICQECINNVFKHSEATFLGISIRSLNNHSYFITIEDNGKGFDPSMKLNNHYGIENMKHRAGELNVQLIVHSENGRGSKITISK